MRHSLFVFLSFLVFVASAFAEEAPIVRIEIEPKVVSVGEPVALTITVLAPTWFPKPPVYPSFDLANAMTRVSPPEGPAVGKNHQPGGERECHRLSDAQ